MSAPADEAGARAAQLGDALAAVRRRLADAARNASRNEKEVDLLPITKFFPVTDIAILATMGCGVFGESRDQEASEKAAALSSLAPPLRWHMVGRIQRNKARSIAEWADVAHSVDSVRVIEALDRASTQAIADGRRTGRLGVYLQISLDADTARGGIPVDQPASVDEACARVAAAQGLEFSGLMGIPPLGSDPDQAFALLAAEHCRVLQAYPEAAGLSAGMSSDLEIAVKHGSTCVRVGTALMGPRPLRSP
ncbi:MAG: YggS family pyridoxal phosphate-dependent enzyme [Mycobacterium sp.]